MFETRFGPRPAWWDGTVCRVPAAAVTRRGEGARVPAMASVVVYGSVGERVWAGVRDVERQVRLTRVTAQAGGPGAGLAACTDRELGDALAGVDALAAQVEQLAVSLVLEVRLSCCPNADERWVG